MPEHEFLVIFIPAELDKFAHDHCVYDELLSSLMTTICIFHTLGVMCVKLCIIIKLWLLDALGSLTVVNDHDEIAALQVALEPGISLKFHLVCLRANPASLQNFFGDLVVWVLLDILRILFATKDGWRPFEFVLHSAIFLHNIGPSEELDASDLINIVFARCLLTIAWSTQTAHYGVVTVKDIHSWALLTLIETNIRGQLCVFAAPLQNQKYRLLYKYCEHYDGPKDRQKATKARSESRLALVKKPERHSE